MSALNKDGDSPHGLFVGLSTVDMVFSFEQFPIEDTKNTARQYMAAAGGPASNAAVAFAYLGGASHLISSLGGSGVADIAKQDLLRHGVQHSDLTEGGEVEPALSAIAIAEISGSRTILTSPAIALDVANPLHAESIETAVQMADVVLLDGHQLEVAMAVASRAKAAQKTVVLDGDLYKPGLENLIPMVDIVIFGKSFIVDGVQNRPELFDYFSSRGPQHVVATSGAGPIDYVSQGIVGHLEVEPVRAVDTLAAGDFFHGAFCCALACGSDLPSALGVASEVAGRSVTQFGTRAWMESGA